MDRTLACQEIGVRIPGPSRFLRKPVQRQLHEVESLGSQKRKSEIKWVISIGHIGHLPM